MEKKRSKGMILPFVLIIFSVLSILGITIISIGGNESIQSVKQYHRVQARYYAQSAVETFADYMVHESKIKTPEEMEKFIIQIMSGPLTTHNFDNVLVKIEAKFIEDNSKIQITSKANHQKETAEVNLTLNYRVAGTGDGGSGGNSSGGIITLPTKSSVAIQNDDNLKRLYPPFTFPNTPDLGKSLGDQTIKGKLTKNNYDTLTLTSHDYKINDSVQLTMKKLKFGKELEFEFGPNGKLDFFVSDSIEFKSKDSELEMNDDDQCSKINIYYGGNSPLNLKKESEINANLFIEKANVIFDKDSEFEGMLFSNGDKIIIGEDSEFNGIIYAPNATVELKKDAEFKGVIMANELKRHKDTKISYKKYDKCLPNNLFGPSDKKIKISYFDESWSR